jgi:hypothetical protein
MLDHTKLLPGDIVLTLNFKDEDNNMPGYWNHCSIYTGRSIIEAQMPPIGKVIESELEEFGQRYKEYAAFRYRADRGDKIIYSAYNMIGQRYGMISSLLFNFRIRGRLNCVALVRQAYKQGTEIDFGWAVPDHVATDDRLQKIF